jgi:hypothetical protein
MMNIMSDLGGMLSKAARERRDTHARACSVFGALLTGIVVHARSALSVETANEVDVDVDVDEAGASEGGAAHYYHARRRRREKAESILAVAYVKCMTELLPMVDVGAAAGGGGRRNGIFGGAVEDDDDVVVVDPRSVDAVRDLTRTLADVLGATGTAGRDAAQADKLHRAALACCAASIRHIPRLFAPHVPAVLGAVVGDVVASMRPEEALGSTMLPPIKRLMATTGFVRVALNCASYDDGARHATAAAGGGGSSGGGGGGDDDDGDPGMIAARDAVASILAEGAIDRLCEALVGKFLRLRPEEIEEWEDDPEGRYETDLAERSPLEEAVGTPRHCGAALLLSLLDRETDRVARALLDLTGRVAATNDRHPSEEDAGGGMMMMMMMLDREACYRALELCRTAMVGGGRRRIDFSDWFRSELGPMLRADLADGAPVATRAMQARAIQVVQAYSTSLKAKEFGEAFGAVSRLVAARDLVTALCAARCVSHLALLHLRGTAESAELSHVRGHSVLALGNAFALANRCESEECLRVDLVRSRALDEVYPFVVGPSFAAPPHPCTRPSHPIECIPPRRCA